MTVISQRQEGLNYAHTLVHHMSGRLNMQVLLIVGWPPLGMFMKKKLGAK